MKHRTTILSAVLLAVVACDQPYNSPITGPKVDPGQAAPAQAPTWRVPGDFATIQDAVKSSNVQNGDQIILTGGSHNGVVLTKSLHFTGIGGASIDNGPMHPAGLSQGFRLEAGSDGSSFENLIFTTDLAIFNSVDGVDGVTVARNTFLNAIQAVSAWRGDGWNIHHNNIVDLRTRCGGGIGILLGDYNGGIVQDNIVANNKITGTLHVSAGDCGGYSGTGIVVYADFRWGRLGAAEIKNNQIVNNSVAMSSDNASLVDVIAVELTDTRDDPLLGPTTIFGNAIGFNDFRGTLNQIVLTPSNLDVVNTISRNLGDSRGHGSHPSVF
jgi:hypothetical protein